MIFKTNGFVHTDKSAHYVSETSFHLDKDFFSLKFEFFGEGKELFFHVTDPSGLLRVQHQSATGPSTVLLHEDETKSGMGTCPGKIQKGKWKITVFTYAPRFNRMWGKISFEVTVFEGKDDSDSRLENHISWVKSDEMEKGNILLKSFEPENINRLDEKWLSGDFHVHSMLSDGSSTPSALLDEGLSKGLDFFFISEHNILATGFAQKKGIIVFPSYEVTTAIGHFNACGLRYVTEGLLSQGPAPAWGALEKLIKDFRGKGVLVSINHPFMAPWEWQYNDLPLSWIDSIEVINDPYARNSGDASEKALTLLDILWNNGFRITGIGGSDTHTKFSASKLGQPVTKVYAKPGSLFSMLEGVKKHRVEIFDALNCEFNYLSEGNVLLPGTDIGSFEDVVLEFSLSLDPGSDPVSLRVIENGNIVKEKKALPGEKCVIESVWKGNANWIRCEMRDRNNRIRGYINPLHRGKQKRTIEKWGDALDLLNSRFK